MVGSPFGWRLRDASSEVAGIFSGTITATSGVDRDVIGCSVGAATWTRGLGWKMSAWAVEEATFGVIDMPSGNSSSQWFAESGTLETGEKGMLVFLVC